MEDNHKAGFVSIIGKPNVGKSTLMNILLKEKLSIVTPKSQTTRHKILGILTEKEYQIIFSDTPGIITPKYSLHEKMVQASYNSLEGADVILWILSFSDSDIDVSILKKIKKKPVIIALNKIDLAKNQNSIKEKIDILQKQVSFAKVIPISAKEDFNLKSIISSILEYLPFHTDFYPTEYISDKPLTFFVGEIIREKIFFNMKQEIPYSSQIVIEDFKEKQQLVVIKAIIHVEKKSQKFILIGKEGNNLKKIGIEARKEISKFLNKVVYLDLFVKVSENWRRKDSSLSKFGY